MKRTARFPGFDTQRILDRLGRDLHHLINTAHDLTGRGVGLKVLAGQGAAIDITTAAKAKARGYRTHKNFIHTAYLILGKRDLRLST